VSRILIVDDDSEIVRTLSISLRARGYEIVTAHDGASALRQVEKTQPDFLVLDLGLPDFDGIALVSALRRKVTVPILILSGRGDLTNKISALDAGADDYLTKPFSIEELLARLRALGRRKVGDLDDLVFELGDVTVDLNAQVVTKRSADTAEEVHLTSTEWRLLEALLRHPGQLRSRRKLLTEVWGSGYPEDSNHLRVYMARLRAKIELDPARPKYLTNEHGMGYRYQP
jgi:two-component system, OmpR family, KDP operon response regulator KdpE